MHRVTSPVRLIPTTLCAALALWLLGGCKEAASPAASIYSSAHSQSTIFIARTAEPSGYMEALFSGIITLDSTGCLRMEGLERHTPIWPRGYRLDVSSGGSVVRSGNDSIVGTIGSKFLLGGGEVHNLDWVMLSSADRERVTARCPGLYWIVSGP